MNVKRNIGVAAFAVSILGMSMPAMAGPWSLGVSALSLATDSARKLDAGASGGQGLELDVRYNLSDSRALELNYGGWEIDISSAGNDKGIDNLSVNYLWGQLAGKHQAYGMLGLGIAQADVANGDEVNYGIFNLGVGWQSAFAERWSAGAELKLQRSKDNESVAGVSDYTDIIFSAGVRYRLGE
jgi:hypothetical protein